MITSLERRALYNLARMNWLNTPSLPSESWQVENYKELPQDALFERLAKLHICFDKSGFIAFSEDFSSPEELTDHLTADRELSAKQEDLAYLILFELWRRFLPEQPSVSILCDELDWQIYYYDEDPERYEASCEKALDRLVSLLQENADQGMDPENVFEAITNYFANDLETFLYDFITEKIENEHHYYAGELIDSLEPFVSDKKWFLLLRFRFSGGLNSLVGKKTFEQIEDEHFKENDLDFNLELLSILNKTTDYSIFSSLVIKTLPLIKEREDLQDLIELVEEHFEVTSQNEKLSLLSTIKESNQTAEKKPLFPKDPLFENLRKLLSQKP